jgi:hypothetical protein
MPTLQGQIGPPWSAIFEHGTHEVPIIYLSDGVVTPQAAVPEPSALVVAAPGSSPSSPSSPSVGVGREGTSISLGQRGRPTCPSERPRSSKARTANSCPNRSDRSPLVAQRSHPRTQAPMRTSSTPCSGHLLLLGPILSLINKMKFLEKTLVHTEQ